MLFVAQERRRETGNGRCLWRKEGDVVETALRWKKITEERVAPGPDPGAPGANVPTLSDIDVFEELWRVWSDGLGLCGRHGDKPVRTEFVVE